MSAAIPPIVLLVLGGTAEARALARQLGDDPRFAIERARDMADATPLQPGVIIDARHPFAPGAVEAAVPVLRLWRPEWTPAPGDDWHHVSDGFAVAALVPYGATVFVATGRGRLTELQGLCDRTVWWRRRGPVEADFPFDAGGWLTEEGPFTEAQEHALFARLGVDWLIVQNAGGAGAYPKLAAARSLGISVAMIARPPCPKPSVATVEAAIAWLDTVAARA